MRAASVELYLAAFLARCETLRTPGRAMIAEPGLRGVLPGAENLQRVQRADEDEQGGVALADAVAAAMSATSSIEGQPELFADYLRSLPSTFHLFAAVDREGDVRATSGSGVFDRYATVMFVNTVPGGVVAASGRR